MRLTSEHPRSLRDREQRQAGSPMSLPILLTLCLFGQQAQAGFAGGAGEPNDPYQIATAGQLISIGSDPNLLGKHFILVCDIDLDPNLPGRKIFTRAVIAPEPNIERPFHGLVFTGSFDGNGHRIRNLNIVGEPIFDLRPFKPIKTAFNLGLFDRVGEGGWIHSLGLEHVSVKGPDSSQYVGGIVGENVGTISNCYVTGSVLGGKESESLGGLAGYNGGSIVNCYSTCHISTGAGSNSIGGLVGYPRSGCVANCYYSGWNGSPNRFTGPLAGNPGLYGGNISSCLWDVSVSKLYERAAVTGLTPAQMQNMQTYLDAGWDMAGESANGTADHWYIPQPSGYPQLTVFSEDYRAHRLAGTGTPENPFQIATAEDLGAMHRGDWSACYRLLANIDLSGITWSSAPVVHFDGKFDGAGFVISNLSVHGGAYLGLFGFLGTNSLITNLGIENARIVSANNTESIGILAGINYGSVVESHATGNVSGERESDSLGGLVGYNGGSISNCYARGAVNGKDNHQLGGLVGKNKGRITHCHAEADVSATGSNGLGGLVGENDYGTIMYSSATGNVSGAGRGVGYGGLVGHASGVIKECCATGSVSGREWCSVVGGLVGSTCWGCRITDCYATGNVSGGDSGNIDLGGFVGWNWKTTITNCYASGKIFVQSRSGHAGGFAGENKESNIINCFCDQQAGGLSRSRVGTGKTTAEMQTAKTFLDAGWDFVGETANGTEDLWWINEGKDYPRLWWQAAGP